jgi:hypothetical protein
MLIIRAGSTVGAAFGERERTGRAKGRKNKMSNRLAEPFPLLGARFVPAESLGQIGPRPSPHATNENSHPGRQDVPVHELVFCHLQAPDEIARVSHLREEIRLPTSVLADPSFDAREKKEMSTASWVHSPCADVLSERFASSQ